LCMDYGDWYEFFGHRNGDFFGPRIGTDWHRLFVFRKRKTFPRNLCLAGRQACNPRM